GRTAVRDALLEQFGHRVLPSARDVLLCHEARGGLQGVRLEVAEHLGSVPEDRVVADTGTAQSFEHLRPDFPMRLDVLVDAVRAHLEDERAALRHATSLLRRLTSPAL